MLLTSELQAAHCNLATACLGDARWSTAARFYQAACWGTIPECAALQAASCPKECMHSWWAKAMKESFVSENFSQSHSSIFVNDTTWSGTPTTFYSQHSCSHPHTHTHLLKAMWLSWISSVPVHPQNYSSSLFCGSEEQKRNLTHAFCCSSVPWKQTDRLSP